MNLKTQLLPLLLFAYLRLPEISICAKCIYNYKFIAKSFLMVYNTFEVSVFLVLDLLFMEFFRRIF